MNNKNKTLSALSLPKFDKIKLNKKSVIWQSEPQETFNPIPGQQTYTQDYLFKCPIDLEYITKIWIDGHLIWRAPLVGIVNSAPFYNGGRFTLKRRFSNKQHVLTEIEFKDIQLVALSSRVFTLEYISKSSVGAI